MTFATTRKTEAPGSNPQSQGLLGLNPTRGQTLQMNSQATVLCSQMMWLGTELENTDPAAEHGTAKETFVSLRAR